jgi:glycine/sarcosine N-methyltransferase
MVQKTEEVYTVGNFYDSLAPAYDAMTGYEGRFAVEKPIFRLLVERHRVRTAIDAGSGTGFHSILLAQLGVQVTAVDVSSEMLEQTASHARAANLPVTLVQSDFQHLADHIHTPVDALFCLGNSFAHLLTDDEVHAALRSFRRALKPGGMLMIQTLNYDRILADQTRIQSVKEVGASTFVRFYDFLSDSIVFNLLILTRTSSGIQHQMSSVPLRPVRSSSLGAVLEMEGFATPTLYGSIAQEPYAPDKSRDLVLITNRDA